MSARTVSLLHILGDTVCGSQLIRLGAQRFGFLFGLVCFGSQVRYECNRSGVGWFERHGGGQDPGTTRENDG